MSGSIHEISSKMGDNHGNCDLFRLDSSVSRKTRKCAIEYAAEGKASLVSRNKCGKFLKTSKVSQREVPV